MRWVGALAVMAALASAAPAAAGDLVYRHDSRDGPDLLAQSSGRPYWLLLAECAGFYGALANMVPDQAESDAYLRDGVEILDLAVARVQADRGLDRAGALDLMRPHIQSARTVGQNSLAGGSTGSLTPETILSSTCGSVRRVYRAAAGV